MNPYLFKVRGLMLFILVLLSIQSFAQSNNPIVIGYTSGQSVTTPDGSKYSFSGGSVVGTTHQSLTPGTDKCMLGMKYGIVFAENAFDKDLFVSKGYFPDYIQLRWELKRYQSSVTNFRVFRKKLGTTDAFAQVAFLSKDVSDWRDEFAESGVLYEYKLFVEGIFPKEQKFLNMLTGIGFRLPAGNISGRVTYKGGAAVPGVSLIAQTDDDFSGSSLYLNGTNAFMGISAPANDPSFKFDTAFTFQAWVLPQSTGNSILFKKANQYSITHSNNRITFRAGTQNLILNFTQKVDTFFHVSAVRQSDSIKLYVTYKEGQTFTASAKLTSTTPANNGTVWIGKDSTNTQYFRGNIDEIRIWQRALKSEEVLTRSLMYIAGTENLLSAYYRLNEGVGDYFYDLSRRGFTYNEKHGGIFNATWSKKIPNLNQLAVKGITDNNGNYIISGIPYTSDGSTYTIVPAYLTHTFDPTQKLLFIGPGSNNFSDINFIDVSSFPVQGYVYYKDTKFPVEGVQVKIDGRTAVTAEGNVITTDNKGFFLIDVPIGKHNLQMAKSGHVFRSDGRFPAAPNSTFDFQSAYTIQQDFIDSTLIKVIGKVVGGPIQGKKPNGYGKVLNNLGNSTIVFTTQKEYILTDKSVDVLSIWPNIYSRGGVKTNVGNTKYSILNASPKRINVEGDVNTGEFTAYLLPEKYVIKSINAGSYTFDDSYHTTIDLENAVLGLTRTDTTLVDSLLLGNGKRKYIYRYDTVSYNSERDFVFRVIPDVSVTHKSGGVCFWDTTTTTLTGSTIKIVGAGKVPLTDYPCFTQRNKYQLKVSVFEKYINSDKSNVEDRVPVSDGEIEIQNELATDNSKQILKIGELGSVDYEFFGGLPNITTGGIGDYLKPFTVVALTGKNKNISTNWRYNGGNFYGYVLGGMPTGNNFVTTGPNNVEMILRDPHGTGSYAYLEKSSSFSKTKNFEVTNQNSISMANKIDFGGKVIVWAGVGAGTITETEVIANATVGFESEQTWVDNNTQTITTTTTKRWETSDAPEFVGANGDLFIGNSTNLVYGKSINIKFVPNANCPTATCTGAAVGGFKIGQDIGLRISPEFATSFIYSQYHIERNLIPNLKMLRNAFLQKATNYTSVHPLGNANYGNKNTTGTLSTAGYSGGNSYNYTMPAGWPVSKHYEDTVAYYNRQIDGWVNALTRNEKEKLESTLLENISFDAGAKYESSSTIDTSDAVESTFEFNIAPSLAGEIGFEALGLGNEFSIEEKYTHTEKKTDGTESTKSVTFGYVLADSDIGDYLSMDIRKPSSQTGPVFKVRGGQSSCPYVGAETSKYHQFGSILSEATMKREVPLITCSNPIATNVPEDENAVFNISLLNASETGDDRWYTLEVNRSKNPDGANISLEGSDLAGGILIRVPAGKAVNKTVFLEKMNPSVFTYNNLELVLSSVCEPNKISDTVQISARFIPVCTNVELTDPTDKWLVNSSSVQLNGTQVQSVPLDFGVDGYNLNHSSFDKILMQYKSSSSSSWITDKIYFVNQSDFNASTETSKEYINNRATVQYSLEMKSLPDRNYDIRAITTCGLVGPTNSSEIAKGIKDTKRPKLFGTPQPADGILSPGEDVSIQFDEPIEAGLLLSRNFQVKGVLNGAQIRHGSVLSFDGVDDNASIIAGPDLNDKDFSVEFWVQRSANTAGVIYAQGDLEIGFNAANKFYTKVGTQTFTTVNSYLTTDDWMHWAVVYSKTDKKVYAYVASDNITITQVLSNTVSSPQPSGRIYVGRTQAGSSYFNGYLHELRVWQKTLGSGTINAFMNQTLSGAEVGIVGYWPMDDAAGAVAIDKSRSHHAVLNGASWTVFPKGFAATYNGTNSYFRIPSGTSIITTDMDMTMEFWFKANNITDQVLFSNGKGDKTDTSPPFENIWVVGSDVAGKLYALNNGTKITVQKPVFDNEWHHFALVLNRNANTSLYVDGAVQAFELSSNFGGLSGATMSLGARSTTSAGNVTYDKFYSGKIDEFRLWRLARTQKLLQMDMSSKLTGNEKGLLSYYPLDKYDVNLVLQQSIADNVLGSTGSATTNVVLDNLDSPNLKDARPVQNVAYEWVTNNDKIILNIKEPANLVEKTVLEFTTEDVEDLNENLLSSPVTWTAFVKKNTMIWNSDNLSFEKKLYDPLTFNVEIKNIGGTAQNYEVSNLPVWLKVDQSNGTLGPDSKLTLKFTVNEAVNIGDFEESIYLSSDFGFKEKLDISLKVFKEAPKWVVNANDYQYNMSVIGAISINEVISTNEGDMIAAFVNDTLRGVGKLQYLESYDMFQFFMDIYSNKPGGETVVFKIWNAGEGKVHVNVDSNQAFQKDVILGMPSNPIIFKVEENVTIDYRLVKGWNWLSFNVKTSSLQNSRNLFSEVNPADGDVVKSMGRFDQFGAVTGWIGEISKQGGYNVREGYKMKVAKADTFSVVGSSVKTDTVAIALRTGWNWIGYPAQMNMLINDAMSNVNFDNGDFIKGQKSFAFYDKKLGWIGSLKALVPQQAYMLQTKLPHAFTYPDPTVLYKTRRENREESQRSSLPWVVNEQDFDNSMSIMMSTDICKEAVDSLADYVVAFSGNECRGIVEATYVPSYNNYVFFLTAFANTTGEILNFKYYDGSSNLLYNLKRTLPFKSDSIVGTVTNPATFEFEESNACRLLSVDNETPLGSNIQVYPNPFNSGFKVMVSDAVANNAALTITDVFGKEVYKTIMSSKIMDVNSQVPLTSGVYILNIKSADKSFSVKLIKE